MPGRSNQRCPGLLTIQRSDTFHNHRYLLLLPTLRQTLCLSEWEKSKNNKPVSLAHIHLQHFFVPVFVGASFPRVTTTIAQYQVIQYLV